MPSTPNLVMQQENNPSAIVVTKGEPQIELVDFDESEIESIQREQWERAMAKKKKEAAMRAV
jgi:hypothetical protein